MTHTIGEIKGCKSSYNDMPLNSRIHSIFNNLHKIGSATSDHRVGEAQEAPSISEDLSIIGNHQGGIDVFLSVVVMVKIPISIL